MNVPTLAWVLTPLGLVVVVAVDLWVNSRGKEFTMRQAGLWVTCYVLLAAVFGAGLALAAGRTYAEQFFAGYLTEYGLSTDNLFVFSLIMTRFAVPRFARHRVLLLGILIALVMRAAFIVSGAALLARLEWLFYLFGAFLIWSAWGLLRGGGEEEFAENRLLRWARSVLPVADAYHGRRLTVRRNGRRLVTPALIVMIAIGTTDLVFALDSIPAILGLTRDPYLVFAANAFALMGLRQLYFLLDGLLERLVYLNKGLAFVLAFIGVKLVMAAMHRTGLERVPEIPTWLSLVVIVLALTVTTVAGLLASRRAPAGRPAGATPPAAVPGAPAAPGSAETPFRAPGAPPSPGDRASASDPERPAERHRRAG